MSLKTRTHGFTAWVNLRLQQPGHSLIKNVLTDLMSENHMINLLNSFTEAKEKDFKSFDGLTPSEKQKEIQKIVRLLKKNRILSDDVVIDSRLLAIRSPDHVFDLLWRLVCHDIWFVWKHGATILRNESPDLLLITPFNFVEEDPKVRCKDSGDSVERSPTCLPPPETCILDMVSTQLKMTSQGSRLICKSLADLFNSHVLGALVNAFVPETLPLEVLINDRWSTNFLLQTIEEMFQINSSFNSGDLLEADKMTICAYFCFFFMMACRYRQCRTVTTELKRIKKAIRMYDCLLENIMAPTRDETMKRKYDFLEKVRYLLKYRAAVEQRFNPETFSSWMEHVEAVKTKRQKILRQKIESKFERLPIPREITIVKLCQITGINLSLTNGEGYILCESQTKVSDCRDIILRNKENGKFISNPKNKKKTRSLIGLCTSSQLYPSRYPKYEIFLQATSKNKLLPNGTTFLYQIFPNNDLHWKQLFIKSAQENETDVVLRMAQFFQKESSFINWKDPKSGNSALHYASRYGNLDVVKRLLQCNADLDSQSKSLSTPLHNAVTKNHPAIIHLLIEWGSDIFIENYLQQTPVDKTKNYKMKIFIEDMYNHYLSTMPSVMKGNEFILKRLIKDHMNEKRSFYSLNSRCVSGSTLLHTAVLWNNIQCINWLLRLGVNPNVTDYKGATPLHRARDQACSKILVDAGCDLNAEDNDGNSPLHIKCFEQKEEDQSCSNLKVIAFLLKKGAKLNKTNETGLLPIQYCAMKGRIDILDYFLKFDKKKLIFKALANQIDLPSLVYLALSRGFTLCAQWLLEHGFHFYEGETEKILFEIVSKSIKTPNTDDILQFVIDNGVNVNVHFEGDNTALHYVCALGASDFTLKSVLEQGANLNIPNENQITPLMSATKSYNIKTAAILIEAGADMMELNLNGQCALDFIQDSDEWVKSESIPENVKKTITTYYWREARNLIQNLTAKVRSRKPDLLKALPPFYLSHQSTSNPKQEKQMPSIFMTQIPDSILKTHQIPNLGF